MLQKYSVLPKERFTRNTNSAAKCLLQLRSIHTGCSGFTRLLEILLMVIPPPTFSARSKMLPVIFLKQLTVTVVRRAVRGIYLKLKFISKVQKPLGRATKSTGDCELDPALSQSSGI